MSEFNPADIGYTRRPRSDRPGDDPAVEVTGEELPRRDREGLPTGYRMRADSHYVDLLTTRPSGVAPPAPAADRPSLHRRASDGPGAGPAREIHEVQDPRGDRLLGELAEELSTIASAADLLSSDPSPMARRVSLDLIRAQTWRASWMLRAHGLLQGAYRPRMQPHELGALLAEVRDGFAAECRLAGTSIDVRVPAWTASVSVDQTAFVAGLSGAVIWTMGLAGTVEGTAIAVSAEIAGGGLDAIVVSQDGGSGATGAQRRSRGAHGQGAEDWVSGLGASVAKAAARLHGADATFLAGDGLRSAVRFTFRRSQ